MHWAGLAQRLREINSDKENGPARFGQPFNQAINGSWSLGAARRAGDSGSLYYTTAMTLRL